MTVCDWKWLGGEEAVRKSYQLGLSHPVELPVQGAQGQSQRGAVICPLRSEQAAYGAGGDQSIYSSRMIFTPELRGKMGSVNAVI